MLMSVRVAAWMLVISMVARLVPLPTLFRLAETKHRWPSSRRLPPEEVARRVDRVLRVGIVKDGSCWKRAAVLRRYLLLDGIDTAVVFGVRREGQETLNGHAWLERDGSPFLEPETPEYVVTFRYPAR